MKPHAGRLDAFGHLLHDHLLGKGGTPLIVERDDGFVSTSAGGPFYFSRFEDWPAPERRAMRYARGRALDVGCGAGRVALHLQEQGHDVVGIDISPLAVKVCRERGLRALVRSVAEVSPDLGTFDTVLMMGNNFGLFGSPARAQRLLRKFHRLTGPKARIIAETTDPYATSDPGHLAYHRRNRRRGRAAGEIRMRVRYGTYATPWFDYLIVSKNELGKILQGTGWHAKRFFESGGPIYVAILEKDA